MAPIQATGSKTTRQPQPEVSKAAQWCSSTLGIENATEFARSEGKAEFTVNGSTYKAALGPGAFGELRSLTCGGITVRFNGMLASDLGRRFDSLSLQLQELQRVFPGQDITADCSRGGSLTLRLTHGGLEQRYRFIGADLVQQKSMPAAEEINALERAQLRHQEACAVWDSRAAEAGAALLGQDNKRLPDLFIRAASGDRRAAQDPNLPSDLRPLFSGLAEAAESVDRASAALGAASSKACGEYTAVAGDRAECRVAAPPSRFTQLFVLYERNGDPQCVVVQGRRIELNELCARLREGRIDGNDSDIASVLSALPGMGKEILRLAAAGGKYGPDQLAGLQSRVFEEDRSIPLAERIEQRAVLLPDILRRLGSVQQVPPTSGPLMRSDTMLICSALFHSEPAVRRGAVAALAAVAGREAQANSPAIAALVKTLETDPDEGVRRGAAIQLGQLSHPAAVAPLAAAVRALTGPEQQLAALVLVRHSEQGREAAFAAAADLARDSGQCLEVLKSASWAGISLERLIKDPQVAEAFLSALADPASAPALSECNTAAAASTVLESLVQEGHPRAKLAAVMLAQDQGGSAAIRQNCEQLLCRYNRGHPGEVLQFAREQLNTIRSEPGTAGAVLAQFIRTRELGIEFPSRMNQETLEAILRNRTESFSDRRPVAVLVYAKEDQEKAFFNDQKLISDLNKAGYRVLYYEAETRNQAVNSLKHALPGGQQAAVIVLAGHGEQDRIRFGPESTPGYALELKDEKLLQEAGVRSLLEDQGQVLLLSCSTGQGTGQAENMANMLRSIFPQAAPHGIWAPTRRYGENRISIEQQNGRPRIKSIEYFYDRGSEPVPSHQASNFEGLRLPPPRQYA